MISAATVTNTLPPSNSTTDEVCQNRIQLLLQGTRPEFRQLQIESNHGTVTVKGRVASFYLRQVAIQCCQQAAGAFRINDQLQVGTI
jgi:osmotically-inducible protein OsmY